MALNTLWRMTHGPASRTGRSHSKRSQLPEAIARAATACSGRIGSLMSPHRAEPARLRAVMEPPVKHRIPFAPPLLGDAEADAARRAILSGWVTQGPEVAAFEQEFAAWCGATHAVAVSSCTAALHVALLALGIAPGDEVVTASHSFIATANVVRHCGARAVFADIEPDTLNLDPARVADAITPRTKAILCVHQIGMPCDLAALRALASERGVALIEDAACAVGSEIRIGGDWQRIGRPVGEVACFSFHPRKILTTGEGGMVTTNDARLAETCRLLRHHGMSVSDAARHGASTVAFEHYACLGYNYRMSDIHAAVGRVQLARLDDMVAERRRLAGRYRARLGENPGLRLHREPEWARSNWQSLWVGFADRIDQGRLMQRLLDQGIATRRGVMCAHREPAYADMATPVPLPHSERAQDRGLLLPLYNGMDDAVQDTVIAALAAALEDA